MIHSQAIQLKRMKHIPPICLVFPVALLATLPSLAQSPPADAASGLNLSLDSPAAPSPNRFGLSYRMGFDAPVSFKNVAPVPAPTIPQYTLDGSPYNYDNGYVLADSSGNAMGYTRYWGYDNANQVSGNGTIVMQKSVSVETASGNDAYDNPMSGVELNYDRELIRKATWRGGLEGAFSYTYMSVHDDPTESAGVTRVNDVYSFPQGGGTVVPPAPYTGRYSLPGPVIVASPSSSSTVIVQDASISGQQDFSADMFGFRFGPYAEIPISKSIALTLGGGFALVCVSSDFSFNQTVTQGGVSAVSAGSGSHSAWRAGGYVAGTLSLALSERWALVAGAQFQDVGHYTQTVNGREATLDLSKTIFATIGLSYSF